MAKKSEHSFSTLAIEQGYCTRAQIAEAMHIVQQSQKLGVREELSGVLLKKNYITADQIRAITELQGQKGNVRIAGYEILEKIGQGGMGAVFKARQISLDRIVALKIMSPKLAADQDYVERFLREARAVAKLNHPNIIVGIDVGRHGKYCYFAMEYVQGKTALDVLLERGRLSQEYILQLALQVAQALEHAHRHGLVHRDIKPDNIMITSRGETKLCDLGLAKRIADGNPNMTLAGSAVGTPHYISPEQAHGELNVRITADIYGLGATLYHLATGTTLFNGENATVIMTKHLVDEAPAAQELNPETSLAFNDLLQKMLARSPKDRHQTPIELIADIEGVMKGGDILARLKPGVSSSMKGPRRPDRGQKNVVRGSQTTGASLSRGPVGVRMPMDKPDFGAFHPKPKGTGAHSSIPLAVASILLITILAVWVVGSSSVQKKGQRTPDDDRAESKRNVNARGALRLDGSGEDNQDGAKPRGLPHVLQGSTETWPPLEEARKSRQDRPQAYLEQLNLYDSALPGAPQSIISVIYLERAQVEQTIKDLFDEKSKIQLTAAQARLEKGDYAGALALLASGEFPGQLLSPENLQEIDRQRQTLESKILEVFERKEGGVLGDLLSDAGKSNDDQERFSRVAQEIRKKYPIPVVNTRLAQMDEKFRRSWMVESKKRQRGFRDLISNIIKKTRKGEWREARKMIDADCASGFLGEHYGDRLQIIEKDLDSKQERSKKAWEALKLSAGSGGLVQLRENGIALVGRIRHAFESPAQGWGVNMENEEGGGRAIYVDKLSPEDLVKWALGGEAEASLKQYAYGMEYFWNGDFHKADLHLAASATNESLSPQVLMYRAWIAFTYNENLSSVESAYAEAKVAGQTAESAVGKWAAMQGLLQELRSDYSGQFEATVRSDGRWKEILAWNPVAKVDRVVAESGTPKKVAGETTGEKVTPPSSSPWKAKSPGDRRPLPVDFTEIGFEIHKMVQAKLDVAHRSRKLDECWSLCMSRDLVSDAMACLFQMYQDPKQWRAQHENGTIAFRLWQTDMMLEARMPEERFDGFVKEWRDLSLRAIPAKAEENKWTGDQVKRERDWILDLEKFGKTEGRDLFQTLDDLDRRGDTDAKSLWSLCDRFRRERPKAPFRHLKTLMKLRAWFPECPEVISGEVQWSLVGLLFREYKYHQQAMVEVDKLLASYPSSKSVKNGDAIWLAAEVRERLAEENRDQANLFLGDALKLYQDFVVQNPKHYYNQRRPKESPPEPESQVRIWRLRKALRLDGP